MGRSRHVTHEAATSNGNAPAEDSGSFQANMATLALAVLVRLTSHAGLCPLSTEHLQQLAVQPA